MNVNPAQDPLAQLRDIHLPMAPSWWPPAPGWWLLGLVAVVLAVFATRFAWTRYRAGAPVRRARSDLTQSFLDFAAERTRSEVVAKRNLADTVNAILKRLALVRYPRAEVAELSGPQWIAFLDATAKTDQFSVGMGRVLGDERFARSFNYDPAALRLAAEYWIGEQRRAAGRALTGAGVARLMQALQSRLKRLLQLPASESSGEPR